MLLIILIAGCTSARKQLLPTNNKGGYFIRYNKTTSNNITNILKISGRVFDVRTRKTISNTQLLLGCYKTITSENGEFTFRINPSNYNSIFIETNFIGYKSILTDFINTTNTNEIQIDFYLEEDDRPLINCEGMIKRKNGLTLVNLIKNELIKISFIMNSLMTNY